MQHTSLKKLECRAVKLNKTKAAYIRKISLRLFTPGGHSKKKLTEFIELSQEKGHGHSFKKRMHKHTK